MENRKYFSFRINVGGNSFPILIEEIINFCSVYKHCLVCLENKDETVKNDHVHCLVWGEEIIEAEWRARIKKEIAYSTSSKNRFAWCDPDINGREFGRACMYICKGTRSQLPNVVVNTDFTEPEIHKLWISYWNENLTIMKKAQEDTSERQIPKLFKKHGDFIREQLLQVPLSQRQYINFKLCKKYVFQEYYEEQKAYDRNKFASVVMGLMLQTNRELFEAAEDDRLAKICGFSNLVVQQGENYLEEHGDI